MRSLAILIAVVCLAPWAETYNILVFPSNIQSHFIFFAEFASILVEHNHTVDMAFASNSKPPGSIDKRIKKLTYPVITPEPLLGTREIAEFQIRMLEAKDTSFFEFMKVVSENQDDVQRQMEQDCVDVLENEAFINQLMNANYDLIVIDFMELTCFPTIPYKLGKPTALFSVPLVSWFYRVPMFPSATPSILGDVSDMTNFWERVWNLFPEIMVESYMNYTTYFVEKYVPEKDAKPAAEILRDTSVWFYLHDPVLTYPRPLMPNTIQISDIMHRQAKPLNREYKTLMDNAKQGVIYFSLGSYFKYLPERYEQKFCEAFSSLDSTLTVLWKTENPPKCQLPSNVVVKSWVPQNDLLGHPNLRLFITHCGLNSYSEAIYHGQPMIAFPMTADQPYNALAMQNKGVGIKMKINSFTPNDLKGNITLILNDNSFRENAKMLGERMRDVDVPAKKRIPFWIEHVIKYGDQHLRNSGYQLALYEFLMLDILGVLILIFFTVMILLLVCCCVSVRITRFLCCQKKNKSKQKKE